MQEVCLIWEEGGSYDSAYSNVILVFATLEEGEQAVEHLTRELEVLKNIAEPSERFNNAWYAFSRGDTSAKQYRAEDRGPLWEQCRQDYEADVKSVLKVYPCVSKMDDGREVVNSPSISPHDAVTFHAAMMPVSKLADLLK